MATNTEVDQLLKKAIRLLHSSSTNSASELRQLLDESIKQRYGAEKMLCNTLSKQHLEEEVNFPGRIATPSPQPAHEDEIINLTSPPTKPISDSPDTILDSDDAAAVAAAATVGPAIRSSVAPILTAADDDVNLKEFGDLNCCVCGEMMFTATNRLIECSKCGALYHQECHKPPISDEDASEDREQQWQCDNCCNKPSASKTPPRPASPEVVVIPDEPLQLLPIAKPHKSTTSSSSSNSNSSPFYRQEAQHQQQQSSNKHQHHRHLSVSSSSSREEQRSLSKGSSKSHILTPSINLISAPDRHSSISKRSHTHTSSSTSSSSSKSSKSRHHESGSSSSRRKSTR